MSTSSSAPVSPAQIALRCAVVLGVSGGIVGLVLGLLAYPPTAWAAVFEVGLPAALVGGLLGAAAGALMRLSARRRPAGGRFSRAG